MEIKVNEKIVIQVDRWCACRTEVIINGQRESPAEFGMMSIVPMPYDDLQAYGLCAACSLAFQPHEVQEMSGIIAVYGLTIEEVKSIQHVLDDVYRGSCCGCD